MKPPTLNDLKRELSTLPLAELVKVCVRLAKFKKENKELLYYVLFDSNYEPAYIERVKAEMDQSFSGINTDTLYIAKKRIRRILRNVDKYIRFSGQKRTEAELRIHFCTRLKQSGIPLHTGTALGNVFDGQILKFRKAVSTLHEDLQHDLTREMERIRTCVNPEPLR
jgi:hypothetical protein